jgi:hypothetical protein
MSYNLYDLRDENGWLVCMQNGLGGILCGLNAELLVVPLFLLSCPIIFLQLYLISKVYLGIILEYIRKYEDPEFLLDFFTEMF